jgi:DNA-binding GntR family transcriptional regulator
MLSKKRPIVEQFRVIIRVIISFFQPHCVPACLPRVSTLISTRRDMASSRTRSATAHQQPAPNSEGNTSAADVVFLGIVKGLEQQTFWPSQRLIEADLAAQFGVGRNSVREALTKLAAEGFVELNRHRGASIRCLTPRETGDVLEVAELMTGLLCRAAARNIAQSNHTSELKQALDDLVAQKGRPDTEQFGRSRRNFYRALLDIGANQELNRLFPTIQMNIVHAQFHPPGLQAMRLKDYGRIGRAVLNGDCAAAEAAGAEHVQHVRNAIETLLQVRQNSR